MQVVRAKKKRHTKRSSSNAPQLELGLKTRFLHGGARKGAGRPKTSEFQPHIRRDKFHAREPLHLTLRLEDGLPSLRRKDLFRCLHNAVAKARTKGLAIIHFSILSNHAHFIVESSQKEDLAKQMQSLGISFAKKLNALRRRTGKVFRERYHAHILRTPLEVKNALRYVLTNEYRHRGKAGRVELDAFSSARHVSDSDWTALLGKTWERIVGFSPWRPETADALVVSPPRTWLLKEGWIRAKA